MYTWQNLISWETAKKDNSVFRETCALSGPVKLLTSGHPVSASHK